MPRRTTNRTTRARDRQRRLRLLELVCLTCGRYELALRSERPESCPGCDAERLRPAELVDELLA